MGERLTGFIHYGADGRMACMIARQDRLRVSGTQFTCTDAEKVAAYDSFFSYSGTYTIQGDRVAHHVALSLFPNWVGGDQVRRFRVAGDVLDIIARLDEGTPQARTALLSWTRSPRG